MFDGPKLQHEVRPEIAARRAALAVLRPLGNKIHAWHLRTAWLVGLADKISESDPRRAGLLQEIDLRLEEVRSARLDLAKKVAALPRSVAGSSRIIDTDRALGSIVSGLEQALVSLIDRGWETTKTRLER